jgi:ribonucleoside-triphosphate reductase
MTGESHSGKGRDFGLKVMKYINKKCEQWKQEENIDYSPYGSPIESTTYKFAKCLKKRFGIIEGITDRDYVTNSYHIPVFEKIDAFSKLKIESEFQELSGGGAISYIEVPNMTKNLYALEKVVKYIYDNIMYAEINTKSDYCQECGYDGEILIDDNNEWYCPQCGNRDHDKLNVARRTCGYIGSNFWNYGRTSEIKDRVLHLN